MSTQPHSDAPKGRVSRPLVRVTSRSTVYRKYTSEPCSTPSALSDACRFPRSVKRDTSGASSCGVWSDRQRVGAVNGPLLITAAPCVLQRTRFWSSDSVWSPSGTLNCCSMTLRKTATVAESSTVTFSVPSLRTRVCHTRVVYVSHTWRPHGMKQATRGGKRARTVCEDAQSFAIKGAFQLRLRGCGTVARGVLTPRCESKKDLATLDIFFSALPYVTWPHPLTLTLRLVHSCRHAASPPPLSCVAPLRTDTACAAPVWVLPQVARRVRESTPSHRRLWRPCFPFSGGHVARGGDRSECYGAHLFHGRAPRRRTCRGRSRECARSHTGAFKRPDPWVLSTFEPCPAPCARDAHSHAPRPA